MDKVYESVYAKYIKGFIKFKRKLGYKFINETHYLYDIDKFACLSKHTKPRITRKFVESYSQIRLNETESNRYKRISILAHLSSYMSDMGVESFIPRLPAFPKSTFTPYIFNQSEIQKIFRISNDLRLQKYNKESVLISFPLILRFLYSTGIRIGEAKKIRNIDININEGYLKINDSKNGKERIIPLDKSLLLLCEKFVEYKKHLPFENKPNDLFFINLSGDKCGIGLNSWFKKCLEIAKIKCAGTKQPPRIHDLRHTFAVTSLAKMAESGIDLYASLPILSIYLGHQSISSTNYYVRLTASMFPNLIKDLDKFYIDIFPKFIDNETN